MDGAWWKKTLLGLQSKHMLGKVSSPYYHYYCIVLYCTFDNVHHMFRIQILNTTVTPLFTTLMTNKLLTLFSTREPWSHMMVCVVIDHEKTH